MVDQRSCDAGTAGDVAHSAKPRFEIRIIEPIPCRAWTTWKFGLAPPPVMGRQRISSTHAGPRMLPRQPATDCNTCKPDWWNHTILSSGKAAEGKRMAGGFSIGGLNSEALIPAKARV